MCGVADWLILQGKCVVPEETRESTSRMVEVGLKDTEKDSAQ